MKTQNEKLLEMWRKGNDAGLGYAIGHEDDTPLEAAERSGHESITEITPEGSVVCHDGHDMIVICDHNGPWAVKVD